jgi:hypothetical protein
MIILDFGSGNTCHNSLDYAKKMIESLAKIDPRDKEVVIKWQLFLNAGDNVPLNRGIFAKAVEFAWGHGYRTSASVFDVPSLDFLLRATYSFDLPFVKIANNPKYYYLINRVPDGIRIIKSVGVREDFGIDTLCCVSEYPADVKQYKSAFTRKMLSSGISDHTTDWTLYNEYEPELYEVHFKLIDSEGLDSGPFSRTPEQLKEIL